LQWHSGFWCLTLVSYYITRVACSTGKLTLIHITWERYTSYLPRSGQFITARPIAPKPCLFSKGWVQQEQRENTNIAHFFFFFRVQNWAPSWDVWRSADLSYFKSNGWSRLWILPMWLKTFKLCSHPNRYPISMAQCLKTVTLCNYWLDATVFKYWALDLIQTSRTCLHFLLSDWSLAASTLNLRVV